MKRPGEDRPSGQRQPRCQPRELDRRDRRRHQFRAAAVEAVQAQFPEPRRPRHAPAGYGPGMGNGWPDTATTASAAPTRQVRITIRCPPAVTVTGPPTSTGAARTPG